MFFFFNLYLFYEGYMKVYYYRDTQKIDGRHWRHYWLPSPRAKLLNSGDRE